MRMLFELIESLQSEIPEGSEANAADGRDEDEQAATDDDEDGYDEDESAEESEGETQAESAEVSGDGSTDKEEAASTTRPKGLGPLSSDEDGATTAAVPTHPPHRFRSKKSLDSLPSKPSKELIETPASYQEPLSGDQEQVLQDLMSQISLLEGGTDAPLEHRHEAMMLMLGSPPKGTQALCDQAPEEPKGHVGLERLIGLAG